MVPMMQPGPEQCRGMLQAQNETSPASKITAMQGKGI